MNNTNNTSGNGSQKKEFVAKGHDIRLKAIQDSGINASITKTSGDVVEGKIIARDRYTITVVDSVTGKDRTIFKHAIEEFSKK